MQREIDSNRIETLLSWCSLSNIQIDSRLEIVPDNTGITVFSRGASISSGQTLVKIPKTAVLSVKSSSASRFIESSPYGLEAQLALSLALLVELQQGLNSRWYGYLQSLPDNGVDLPIFWGLENEIKPSLDDGQAALRWLTGTEIEPLLLGPEDFLIDHIRHYFDNIAVPTINRFLTSNPNKDSGSTTESKQSTITQFFRAFSLVSSRAFLVDAYHGLSMVPIADAFNHGSDHHVHIEAGFFQPRTPWDACLISPFFQTEYEVCPECGSVQQCPHDRDLDIDVGYPSGASRVLEPESDDTYDMVSNTDILPHCEVLNTYGESLSNAQLLSQYGFALDVNENDHISWKFGELLRFLNSISTVSHHRLDRDDSPFGLPWNVLVESFDQDIFSVSELVFTPSSLDSNTTFSISCEGKVSWQLWLLIASYQCARLVPASKLMAFLGQLGRYQTVRENDDDEPGFVDSDVPSLQKATASTIVILCKRRKAGMGDSRGLQNLGDLLDELDESQTRTRLALLQVITELSILESCEAAWQELNC